MSAQAIEDDSKAVATLTAQAALAGIELVRLADGSFIVSRWGLVRPIATLEDARAWLAMVTGQAAR